MFILDHAVLSIRWDDGTSNGVRLLRIDSSNEHMYLKGSSLGSSFRSTGFHRMYEIQGSFLVMLHEITVVTKLGITSQFV